MTQPVVRLVDWDKIYKRVNDVIKSGYGWVTVKIQNGEVVTLEYGFTEREVK